MSTNLAIPDDLKDTIAEAVHLAVCEHTQSDGTGQCYWYTIAAWPLLRVVTGLPFMPQFGSLHLLVDEPDGWFHLDCSHGGMHRGEFHGWLVLPGEADARGRIPPLQVVDFSTRYWHRLVENTQWGMKDARSSEEGTFYLVQPNQERIPWTRPAPPIYLWCEGMPPSWIGYEADLATMDHFAKSLTENHDSLMALHKLVRANFMRLRTGQHQ